MVSILHDIAILSVTQRSFVYSDVHKSSQTISHKFGDGIWKERDSDGEAINFEDYPCIFQPEVIGIQICAEGILNCLHGGGLVEVLSYS